MRKYRKYVMCCSLTLTRLDGVTTTTLSISGVAVTVHNTFSDLCYNVFMSVCVCSIEIVWLTYHQGFVSTKNTKWIYQDLLQLCTLLLPKALNTVARGHTGAQNKYSKLVNHLLVILTLSLSSGTSALLKDNHTTQNLPIMDTLTWWNYTEPVGFPLTLYYFWEH